MAAAQPAYSDYVPIPCPKPKPRLRLVVSNPGKGSRHNKKRCSYGGRPVVISRARYYDPRAGRFITRDPIGFGGGINQYVYVRNNPINRIDPSGLIAGVGIGAEGMLLMGGGLETHWCCDKSNNLWRVRTRKVCFGLGAGASGGGSMTIGSRKSCPYSYRGVTVESAFGPLSGDNSPGADWGDIGAGPGFMVKIFVICISTFTDPPQKLGCCEY